MLRHILPLIPKHKLYCEPFFGGGAVFFAKEPAKVEVVNDKNDVIVSFYKELQSNWQGLRKYLDSILYTDNTKKEMFSVYKNPENASRLEKAAALFFLVYSGYGGRIEKHLVKKLGCNRATDFFNKKKLINKHISERIQHVTIHNRDALDVITMYDHPDAFFYIDPPYVGADQGHYAGYTQEEFNALLKCLSKLKGKFMLSSYPNDALHTACSLHEWDQNSYRMDSPCATKSKSKNRSKYECLTMNYELPKTLFS